MLLWRYFMEVLTLSRLSYAMQDLDARSQVIIKTRWLDDENKATLHELAARVRQLEKNAMKKLRVAIES